MSLNIGNESLGENPVVILSSVGQLLVTLGDTLYFLEDTLAGEDVNDRQIRGLIQEQQELVFKLNLLAQKLIELIKQQITFLQKQIEKKSIN